MTKTLWKMEKLLVLRNFFFCRYVFKNPSAAGASESVYMRERVNPSHHIDTVWRLCSTPHLKNLWQKELHTIVSYCDKSFSKNIHPHSTNGLLTFVQLYNGVCWISYQYYWSFYSDTSQSVVMLNHYRCLFAWIINSNTNRYFIFSIYVSLSLLFYIYLDSLI